MLESQIDYMRYVKDESHVHSPATVKLMDLAITLIDRAVEAVKEGRKVIWEAQAVDAPLVYASGGIPVSYIELCRLGTKKAASYVENQLQVPGDVCSMVKVMLGEMHYLGKKNAEYIHANTGVCEPFNLAFELLEKEGFQVLYQDTPLTPVSSQMSRKQYDEICSRRIADWQEISNWISGHDIDEKRLAEEQKRFNRTLQKVNKINELRMKHRVYLANLPAAYIILGIGNYFGEPEEYEKILDMFIEELSGLADGEYDAHVIPLVWSGSRSVDFGICHSLDQAGAMIADWNVPTGLHNFFREDENPIDALIHYTVGYPATEPSGAMGIVALENMIQQTAAKGVLFYGYMGCPMCAVNTYLSSGYVKEKIKIPYLSLDGSFPTEAPTGQLVTRIEAFAEMLRGQRK